MKKKPSLPFLIIAIFLVGFGLWGAVTSAWRYFNPPPSAAYALENLSAEQLEGFAAAQAEDGAGKPAFAPTLEVESSAAKPAITPSPSQTAITGPTPIPPTPTPLPQPPDEISIASIDLKAPVIPARDKTYKVNGIEYRQWIVPDEFAAGWSADSGAPGGGTNIVLFGHHNVNGAVFAHLVDVREGDLVTISSGKKNFTYKVSLITKVQDRGVSFDQMLKNASWILPTPQERLTLVTCWPPYGNNYRLIIVALPR